MDKSELIEYLLEKFEELYENSRLDDTEGDFRDGAKDYLIQVLDTLENLKKEEA